MRKPSGQSLFLGAVAVGCALALGYLAATGHNDLENHAVAGNTRSRLEDIPFDGARSYQYLQQLCNIGVRHSGSPGMQEQQELLEQHFAAAGGRVSRQEFRVRHPNTGTPVEMANLIVEWHPDRPVRILVCTHYDTRPFPDKDRRNPRGTFIGANDGASGVALLMEMSRHMPDLKGPLGVDFVLFDGEELVYGDNDPYFLGSRWFAEQYASKPPAHRYRWGVLLDMIGDKDLKIFQEQNSAGWADTRPLVDSLWQTARRLGVTEFVAKTKYAVNDDHLGLHDIAKIPTCDVIDFDYPYWHTEGDIAERCSALSLAKVGWVVKTWLEAQTSGKK